MKLIDILKTNADSAKSYIENLLEKKQDALIFDSTPTADSKNPVTSDGIKKAIDAKTVDTSNLQTKLTFDTTPTANSNNPVTSNGIKNYIDTIDNTLTTAISKKADSSKIPSIPTNISAFTNDAGYIQYYSLNGENLKIIKANKIVNYDEQIPAISSTPGIVLKEDSSNITYGNVDIRALENCKISFSFYEGGVVKLYDYTLDMYGNFSGNAATATKATQDGNGNVITDTYATKTELNSKTVDLSSYYTKTQVDSAISTAISSIVDGDSKSY